MAMPTMRDMERVKRIGRYLVGEPRARCWFRLQHSGELEAYSDADCQSDKATRRSLSAAIIMRGAHCLKVWTKKQQVERAVRRGEDRIGRAGDPERRNGLGNIVWVESAPGCLSNNLHGQSQRSGQGEARRHAESVDTEGFQIWRVLHEESRHERESRRPDDETTGEAEDRTAHGLRVHGG